MLLKFQEFHPPISERLKEVMGLLVSSIIFAISSISVALILSFGFEDCEVPNRLDRTWAWLPLFLLDISICTFVWGLLLWCVKDGPEWMIANLCYLAGWLVLVIFLASLYTCWSVARAVPRISEKKSVWASAGSCGLHCVKILALVNSSAYGYDSLSDTRRCDHLSFS